VAASGFPVVGIGANAQAAYAPFRTVVKGQRISIIGATDILPPGWDATDSRGGVASAHDLSRLLGAVAAERAHADTLAVFLHWGVEGVACPVADQQGLARALVGAGADIVVGSHPHVVQGGGRLGPALVEYSLGNFVWYNEGGESANTGVIKVTATGRDIGGYSWVPARISNGVPRMLTGVAADLAQADWQGRRACTNLTP
jgi:poly-gamma-glutamate synthesis protein (capsule biosynthesis protein)